MITIKKTSNYSTFKIYKENRTIRPLFVKTLKNSIRKKNLLHLNPIIINEKKEIIDGQHRLQAALELSVPIYYIKDSGLGFEDILLLNANVVKWSTQEYLDAYIKLKVEDYVVLKKFCHKHNLSISNGLAILNLEKGSRDFRCPLYAFKSGNFRVKNKVLAEKFILFVKRMKPFLLENVTCDRDFLRAVWNIYLNKNIDREILFEKLAQFPRKIFRVTTLREYLRQFEDVYNYQERAQGGIKKQIRFF